MIRVSAKHRSGEDQQGVYIEKTPDKCPLCHRTIHLSPGFLSINGDKSRIQMMCRCTAPECDELFITSYEYSGNHQYRFVGSAPVKVQYFQFADVVREVSPSFVEIYNQAMEAEAKSLDQLVGIGLRKALEFLMKDFTAAQHPDEVEKIRSLQLGPCINQFVTDPNIKACAARAAWLGNDETHYVRKWSDRDVSDLKVLVRLTTNWIESTLLTQKYVEEMQRGA